MMEPELFGRLLEYGPFAALCFALIYYMRKDHRQDYLGVTRRLNEVEDYQKNKMTDTLAKNTVAIANNTEMLARVDETIRACNSNN